MTSCAGAERPAARRRSLWALLPALLVAIMLTSAPAQAKKGKKDKKARDLPSPEELFNPLLGIDYSHWLVGPVLHIASQEEIDAYLALSSDPEAESFIEAFWARRNENTPIFQDTPEEIYDQRLEEANKRFSEAAVPGSNTVRGRIFVLYGEPESITFEEPRVVDDPTPELWTYPSDAPPGLDGRRPERHYRFVKEGELTVLLDEHLRRKMRARERHRRGRGG